MALVYLALLLLIPLVAVFWRTFEHGISEPLDAVTTQDGLHAFWLTILCVGIAVPLNTVFGVVTALVLVRQNFRGKALLNAPIDLPFAISPVVIGLALFLVYAPRDSWFGETLAQNGIQVIFSVPGMVLATIFVSLPFVVREVMPVLQEIGTDQEEAAETLGASPLADLLEGDPAGDPVGARLRHRARHGAGARRVRCGCRRLGSPSTARRRRCRSSCSASSTTSMWRGPMPRDLVLAILALRRPLQHELPAATVGAGARRRGRRARASARAPFSSRSPSKRRPEMAISVKNVTKRFGDFVALDDVSIDVPDGGLTALLGPSGSGKSTLLRVIAGLEQPDSGQVLISGEDNTETRVQDRNVGFVFQHYAAFKHMTVYDNIAFGLKIRGEGNGHDPRAGQEADRAGPPEGLREALPEPALGRTAPAHGAGQGARGRAAGAAARRAVRRARRQGARRSCAPGCAASTTRST